MIRGRHGQGSGEDLDRTNVGVARQNRISNNGKNLTQWSMVVRMRLLCSRRAR